MINIYLLYSMSSFLNFIMVFILASLNCEPALMNLMNTWLIVCKEWPTVG